MHVLIIGLGSMGYGAAVSLLHQGFQTTGYDLNPEALTRFERDGGRAITQLDSVSEVDCVFVFVVNAQQAEHVLLHSALEGALNPNALVINCVTLAPSTAIALARQVQARGFQYIDAPVSGGAAKARAGRMSIMASGDPEAMHRAEPLFEAIAEKVFHLGDTPGHGSQLKLINQLLAGVHIAAAAEAMNLAASLDMDLHHVIEVISGCAGTSWMFENRAPHIADGDYTPLSNVNIFVKDLGIVTDEAAQFGVATPLSTQALALYQEAVDAGLGGEDDSAVVKVLAAQSHTRLPKADS
jgi:3-hydroxyisobutyrate dehydrogenase-like beta-hydroxyacid dehydrogenase